MYVYAVSACVLCSYVMYACVCVRLCLHVCVGMCTYVCHVM